MVNANTMIEPYPHHLDAIEKARQAGVAANKGYRHKLFFVETDNIIKRWQDLMVNAPIVLHNWLFLLFFIVDILVSWEIFRVLIEYTNMITQPGWKNVAILLLCLLINAWAVATAHFIGKGWSKEILDWERWNYVFIKRHDLPATSLDALMHKEKIRARWLAIISGTVLLVVIGFVTRLRFVLMSEGLDPMDISTNFGNIVMLILPFCIIIGELFTGDYVWYSVRWLQARIRRWWHQRRFAEFKEQCGILDLEAVQQSANAKRRNLPIEISGDMERSHLRVKYRSQQDNDYLDPYFRRIGFSFHFRETRLPISNTSVFGILPNGAKTGDHKTDTDGKVVLQWDGDWDRLVSVHILSREYLGPFQSNAEHHIDIPDLEPANGNGHSHFEAAETNLS